MLLPGGNVNPVVRVGDTVRRPTGPWTPAVHRLLRHLEAHGFDGAPRVLGVDDEGREILTYVAGETDAPRSDRELAAAARLIRRYHDVCRSFDQPADMEWQVMVGAPDRGEIVCHNDLAPFNAIFRDGVPFAFVDWDLAAPGPPVWDVAYAAWRFVPLYGERDADIAAQARRLRLLADGYGLASSERTRLVATVERRIRCSFDTLRAWGEDGKPGWARMWQERTHGDGMLRDLEYVAEHRGVLAQALA